MKAKVATSSGQTYVVHRTAKGVWSRASIGNLSQGEVQGLARLPGTSSLWAVGRKLTKTSSSSVIWADGTV